MNATSGDPVRRDDLAGGAIWRLTLNRPKANVIDAAMTAALSAAFAAAARTSGLKAIVLAAEGPHFSFGASVAEHRQDQVAAMLHGFHGLFRQIAAAAVTVVCAVRGQCLGGGLELASFCHRLIAAPGAQFGQPEIRLGVFAPAASLILPARVGPAAAADLLCTGRTVDAETALRLRLVDQVDADPEAAAQACCEQLLPHSAASLRHAVRAARWQFERDFLAGIEALERSYLGDLMATADASEGIEAFLQKRSPQWRNA
jgi:cyclohexa-1,5-dienecarbonyl-CoA hydratase